MNNPLHPDEHAERLKSEGHDILGTLKQDETSRKSFRPFGYHLDDGFYRIVQRQRDGKLADVSLHSSTNSSSNQGEYPVMMSTADSQAAVWRLTRQYGVKNGFTIVPKDMPPEELKNSPLGGTTYIQGGSVYVNRSLNYPVWNVEFMEQKAIRNRKTDVITYHNYFSVWESAKSKYWTTNGPGNVTLESGPDEDLPSNQLYELIKATDEQIVTVSSLKPLSVKASDGTVVRKLYFGTNKLSTDTIRRYISVQLEADASDQGWATYPDRGLWSWFELAIFRKLPEEGAQVEPDQIKSGPGGKPLTWISHRIPLSNQRSVQKGEIFAQDSGLLKSLEDGDQIGVLACAQYRAWEGDVRNGKLIIHELGTESV